jgi:hypothetical protein
MALSDYIIRQFTNGKLTHNSISAALATAAVKSRAESLGVNPAPLDHNRLRKPYMGRKRAVAVKTVSTLSVIKG